MAWVDVSGGWIRLDGGWWLGRCHHHDFDHDSWHHDEDKYEYEYEHEWGGLLYLCCYQMSFTQNVGNTSCTSSIHTTYLILQQQPPTFTPNNCSAPVPSPHCAHPLPSHWSPPLAPVEEPDHLDVIPSVVPFDVIWWHLMPFGMAKCTLEIWADAADAKTSVESWCWCWLCPGFLRILELDLGYLGCGLPAPWENKSKATAVVQFVGNHGLRLKFPPGKLGQHHGLTLLVAALLRENSCTSDYNEPSCAKAYTTYPNPNA